MAATEALPMSATGRFYGCCCNVVAPALALVACAVALVAAVYFQSYYLCIPYGLGILGSCYAIYSAYYDSKAFQESMLRITTERGRLSQEVNRLQGVTATQATTTQRLQTHVDRLQQYVGDLSVSTAALERLRTDIPQLLQGENNLVNQVRTDMQEVTRLREALQRTNFTQSLEAQAQVTEQLVSASARLTEVTANVAAGQAQLVGLERLRIEREGEIAGLKLVKEGLASEVSRLAEEIDRIRGIRQE